MALLVVKRNSEWMNRFRNIELELDGKPLGNIGNGETKEFDVPAGNYTFCGKIDWCSSPEIELELNENETTNVGLSGFGGARFLSLTRFISIPVFIMVVFFRSVFEERPWLWPVLLLLILPGFLYMTYYMTLGRKKHLQLHVI
jgi:hypothetical protein